MIGKILKDPVGIGKVKTSGIWEKITEPVKEIVKPIVKDVVDTALDKLKELTDEAIGLAKTLLNDPDFIKNILKKLEDPRTILLFIKIMKAYNDNLPKMKKRGKLMASTMGEEEKWYARMSDAAYQYYKGNKIAQIKGSNYTMDYDLSDNKSVVFFSGDKAVIGYRGTVPTNLSDLISDVYIGLAEEENSERFRDALKKYAEVSKKYKTVETTGHSLGGSQAIFVATRTGCNCVAFNPGSGVGESYLSQINKYDNIKTLHIETDPVSMLAGMQNCKQIIRFPRVSNNPLECHSLSHFLF